MECNVGLGSLAEAIESTPFNFNSRTVMVPFAPGPCH